MKENKKGQSGEATAPEGYHRPNFLYQAASIVTKTVDSKIGLKIAACYGGHINNICKKLQLKLDRDIKRNICKGCNTFLVPGETAKITITTISKKRRKQKKQKRLEITCNLCSFKRPFLLNEKSKSSNE